MLYGLCLPIRSATHLPEQIAQELINYRKFYESRGIIVSDNPGFMVWEWRS